MFLPHSFFHKVRDLTSGSGDVSIRSNESVKNIVTNQISVVFYFQIWEKVVDV